MIRSVQVEGVAMEPALSHRQIVPVDTAAYRAAQPQCGDVILFTSPRDPEREWIKRVIGLPGETVAVHGGIVFLNDQPLDEPYVPPQYRADDDEMAPTIVPLRHLFVLGDRRISSYDSLRWGMLPDTLVIGKVLLGHG